MSPGSKSNVYNLFTDGANEADSISLPSVHLGGADMVPPVQLAAESEDAHDVPIMATLIREAIVTACERADGIDAAWMADDGSEFVVAGSAPVFAGCELAARISEEVTVTVGGKDGPWIEGMFMSKLAALRTGLRQVWSRQAAAT